MDFSEVNCHKYKFYLQGNAYTLGEIACGFLGLSQVLNC